MVGAPTATPPAARPSTRVSHSEPHLTSDSGNNGCPVGYPPVTPPRAETATPSRSALTPQRAKAPKRPDDPPGNQAQAANRGCETIQSLTIRNDPPIHPLGSPLGHPPLQDRVFPRRGKNSSHTRGGEQNRPPPGVNDSRTALRVRPPPPLARPLGAGRAGGGTHDVSCPQHTRFVSWQHKR